MITYQKQYNQFFYKRNLQNITMLFQLLCTEAEKSCPDFAMNSMAVICNVNIIF